MVQIHAEYDADNHQDVFWEIHQFNIFIIWKYTKARFHWFQHLFYVAFIKNFHQKIRAFFRILKL
jgi:hypothetical protein